jgi:disulfide oxidoreductase YuzD
LQLRKKLAVCSGYDLKKLKERLGDVFDIKLIEIFFSESFSYKEIIEGIQQEKFQTPLVMFDGRIIQSGGKLSERKIRNFIERINQYDRIK